MKKLETRLQVLERLNDTAPTGLLPTVVRDAVTDAELANMRRTRRKVYRARDPSLVDEFIF